MRILTKQAVLCLALALLITLSALPVYAADPIGLPEIDHPFFDLKTIQLLCLRKAPEGKKVAFCDFMEEPTDTSDLDFWVRTHDDSEMIDLIDPATGLEVGVSYSLEDSKRFELWALTVLRTEEDDSRRAIALRYEYPKKSKTPVLREANLEVSFHNWYAARDQMSACIHNYLMDTSNVNELVAQLFADPDMPLVDASCRPTEQVLPYLAPEVAESLHASSELDPLPPELIDRIIEVVGDDETLGLLLKKAKIPEGMSGFRMTDYIKADKDDPYSSITILNKKLGLEFEVSSFEAIESGKPLDGIIEITRQVDPKNCFAKVLVFKSPNSMVSTEESVSFEAARYVNTEKEDDSWFRKAFYSHEIYLNSDWREYVRGLLTSEHGLLVDGKFNPDYVDIHP